jgi:hypothetical protein
LCAAFALDLQVNNTKTSPYPWILQVNVQQNVLAVKQVFTFFIGATFTFFCHSLPMVWVIDT